MTSRYFIVSEAQLLEFVTVGFNSSCQDNNAERQAYTDIIRLGFLAEACADTIKLLNLEQL